MPFAEGRGLEEFRDSKSKRLFEFLKAVYVKDDEVSKSTARQVRMEKRGPDRAGD